ncbi:unnamed protein product [Lactuca saligna]|uniref:Uncharacterized protein n=1 Tax=Lactuca saligna TaxID=75948 RepID=A0AA36E9F8_LACSI|nr:unnamed protein product [Lactuca saligna]
METSESISTPAVTIVITPPIQTIPPPPPTTLSPPPPSSPEFLDLLRCNHQNLWNCFRRKLKRYIGCFESEDSSSLEIKGESKNDSFEGVSSTSTAPSPNYYSYMNHEERDEKLKSAIVYCKHSTN